MKTFYKITVATMMVAALTACGGSGTSTPAATATPAATTGLLPNFNCTK